MNDPTPNADGALTAAHFSSVVEGVVKAAAAIAAAGYIALRAHFNALGIPLQSSLGTDRYLMEAWGFISFLAPRAILTAGALGIVAVVIELLRSIHAMQRAVASWTRATASIVSWITARADFLLPFALLTVEVLAWLLYARASHDLGVDLVIGPLNRTRLLAPRGVVSFDVLSVVGLIGYVVSLRAGRRTAGSAIRPSVRALWALQWIALIVVLVQVPVAYGSFVHPTRYRTIVVETQGTPPTRVEGLLLYETEHALAVWRCASGRGSVDLVERGSSVVQIGPLRDLISDAADAAPPAFVTRR